MDQKRRLLITGATGLIGFRILIDALDANYVVRAVVRSPEKKAKLLQHHRVERAATASQLSFVEIPNFTSSQAWSIALDGITFVIHAASPLPLPVLDPEKDIFEPITLGNSALLQAALKTPGLQRIVFTSTILATMPLPPRDQGPYSAQTRYSAPWNSFDTVYDAYQGAKMQLLERCDEFASAASPSFDVINVFPGYTFGPNLSAQRASDMFSSSNGLLLALLKGRKFQGSRTAGAAHIEDVSRVHIRALDPDIPGNAAYGVTTPMEYDAAILIAKTHFPEAFADGTFNMDGSQPSEVVHWDAKVTEKVFGITFKSYEMMVVDVVTQYLKLLTQEKSL